MHWSDFQVKQQVITGTTWLGLTSKTYMVHLVRHGASIDLLRVPTMCGLTTHLDLLFK